MTGNGTARYPETTRGITPYKMAGASQKRLYNRGPRELLLIEPVDDVGFLVGPGEFEGGLDAVAFFGGVLPGEAQLTEPAGGPDGGIELGAGDAHGRGRGGVYPA